MKDSGIAALLAMSLSDTRPMIIDVEPVEVMTVDEGAEYLRIGRSTLYDAIGRGEVPHVRIGRQIRLHRSALVRWLSGSCEASKEKR